LLPVLGYSIIKEDVILTDSEFQKGIQHLNSQSSKLRNALKDYIPHYEKESLEELSLPEVPSAS